MVELLNREFLSLANVGRLLPGRPSSSCIWRWIRTGVGGIKLEAVRIGGRMFVTPEALSTFVKQTTEADAARFEAARAARQAEQAAAKSARPRPASERRRQKQIDEAMESLRQQGVKV